MDQVLMENSWLDDKTRQKAIGMIIVFILVIFIYQYPIVSKGTQNDENYKVQHWVS